MLLRPRLLANSRSSSRSRSRTAHSAARSDRFFVWGSSSSSSSSNSGTPSAASAARRRRFFSRITSTTCAGFSSLSSSHFFRSRGSQPQHGALSTTATAIQQPQPQRQRRRPASSSSTNSNNGKKKKIQTTVHGLGEGWTGALGTGRLDASVAGHSERDELDGVVGAPCTVYTTTTAAVLSCAAGWGHSALVVREDGDDDEREEAAAAAAASGGDDCEENDPDPVAAAAAVTPTKNSSSTKRRRRHSSSSNHKLLVTGRPHEFLSLLRLRRQPAWLRRYAADRAHRTTRGDRRFYRSLHPVDLLGRTIQFLADLFLKKEVDWDRAREHSFLTTLTEIPVPGSSSSGGGSKEKAADTNNAATDEEDHQPVAVACSAGLTAVTSRSGRVYTFGLNGMGQCGIGFDCNNVWTPTAVTGLSSEFAATGRPALPQSHPVRKTVLGLQHGLCLNTAGELFSWGKGERGQLGHELGARESKESHTAQPIQRALLEVADDQGKPVYHALGRVSQVAAGMIHSAALEEETNRVFLWGKNLLPLPPDGMPGEGETRGRKVASDARLPFHLRGLPPELKVLQIACGSHHTSFLLEDGSVWALGLATDTKEPLHEPFCLMEPGLFELPVRQFAAHMDRTTVVTATGEVLQAHVWKEPENRAYAIFTPAWVDPLLDACEPGTRIREVHRSWLHTLIVTEREIEE